MERRYQEIREYTEHEIKEILDQQVIEELILLPISVGLYHHSWKIRQNEEYRGTIIDAISDINQFLGWKLAKRYFNNENQ